MTFANLSDLHDEELILECSPRRYNDNKMHIWGRRGHDRNDKNVSLKEVLSMKVKSKSNNDSNKGTINTKTPCRCTNSGNSNIEYLKRKRVTVSNTEISADWSRVRSRAYKKFVSFVIEQQQTRQQKRLRELSSDDLLTHLSTKTESESDSKSDETLMWWLLQDAAAHPESSTRRVCNALLAHSFGGPKCPYYYQKIARWCWRGYLVSSQQRETLPSSSSSSSPPPPSSCGWLRMYSEWLSECSIFDQREQAWEAFQPLLQHVVTSLKNHTDQYLRQGATSTVSKSRNQNRDKDKEVCTQSHDVTFMCCKEITPSLLACLGYILHRRSHLFESSRADKETCNNSNNSKTSIGREFRSFVDLLSIHCGESSELWLRLFSNSNNVQDFVENTLQRLGVLSFSVLDLKRKSKLAPIMNNYSDSKTHTNTKINKYLHLLATSNWPYDSQFKLRNAMSRIDQSVLSLDNRNDSVISLLTCPINGDTMTDNKTKKNKKTNKSMSSVPMMHYLYDSGIMYLIFSFCSPKRLSKIPQVCKSWKAIVDTASNTLWHKAYVVKFGIYQWSRSIAEKRYLAVTNTSSNINTNTHSTENVSKTLWKDYFVKKQVVEQIVRFQRNPRTGYKHRTCSFLGCLKILKTSNQEHKHNQMHVRHLAKRKRVTT